MSPQRINLALRAAAVVMMAAAPLVLAAGFLLPLASADVEPRTTRAATTVPAGGNATAGASIDSFGDTVTRRLRPPLGDAGAPLPPAETSAAAPPPTVPVDRLQLVGTIGSAMALIKGPNGMVAIVQMGDDVEGALVVAIRDRQIDLRQGDRLIRLEKTLPPGSGSGDIIVR